MRFDGAAPLRVVGTGMTAHARRDLSPETMAHDATREALEEAGLVPGDVALVVVSNALGGALCAQDCIRGEAWLGEFGFAGTAVLNVENACAGGINAIHVACLAAAAGESPVLVLGVEKMWSGDRRATMEGLEEGLPAQEREEKRSTVGANPSGSVFMGLNAQWARDHLARTETTTEHLAAAAAKAHFHGSLNPLAQMRTRLSIEEILSAPVVVEPLTRPMCSSFTDGAAALVVSTRGGRSAPRIVSSTLMSGDGSGEYHRRMGEAAGRAWNESGYGPDAIDIIELHDATSAEELLALEAMGFFPEGKAGASALAGDTTIGGSGVTVNPSGGLVARGHPVGATGGAQAVEIARQLRGSAGERQVESPRIAAAVNTGGIIGEDVASVGVLVMSSS